MTGFNMPPGCNPSDIPGNRPEDLAAEAAYEKICEELELAELVDAMHDDEEWADKLAQFILKKQSDAWNAGYVEGCREEQSHQEQLKIEQAAKEWRNGEAKR